MRALGIVFDRESICCVCAEQVLGPFGEYGHLQLAMARTHLESGDGICPECGQAYGSPRALEAAGRIVAALRSEVKDD